MKKLSNKLSKAILQALEDMELVLSDDNYRLNFIAYHSPEKKTGKEQFETLKGTVCTVCFAGSVMAKRLNGNHNINLGPLDFPKHTKMLIALDKIRRGDIYSALDRLNIQWNSKWKDTMPANQTNKEQFIKDMKEISQYIKSIGY